MTYQKPELFLVGSAQGLVLGGLPDADFSDRGEGGHNCETGGVSRNEPIC